MEDDPSIGPDGTEPPEPASDIPSLPPEVVSREAELRRLVDAGASSPEELRALAARLQEQREVEEQAWRREVRPALMQAKKKRMALPDLRVGERDRHQLMMGAMLLAAVVVLVVIASLTSAVVLIIPAVGVLAYAYVMGRKA
jgi:Flp pilus assembly protein TadB